MSTNPVLLLAIFFSILSLVNCAPKAEDLEIEIENNQQIEVKYPENILIQGPTKSYSAQKIRIEKDTIFADSISIPKKEITMIEVHNSKQERIDNILEGTFLGIIGYSILIGAGIVIYKLIE